MPRKKSSKRSDTILTKYTNSIKFESTYSKEYVPLFFICFLISQGRLQPKEDKSIVITPWTEITRRHTKHITLKQITTGL